MLVLLLPSVPPTQAGSAAHLRDVCLVKGKNSKHKEGAPLVQTNKRAAQPKYNFREKLSKKVAHPYYSFQVKLNALSIYFLMWCLHVDSISHQETTINEKEWIGYCTGQYIICPTDTETGRTRGEEKGYRFFYLSLGQEKISTK